MLGLVTGYMLLASSVRAQVENFDEALKNTLLAHHQRHVPQVIVKGSEVTLVYAPGHGMDQKRGSRRCGQDGRS
jgi:hypothetical protein